MIQTLNFSRKNGFTLIELVIVVAIIGLLAATIAFSVSVMIQRSKVAKALGDLNNIAKAIKSLEVDTGRHPAGLTYTPCNQDPEIVISDDANVGLIAGNPALFPGWKGPYIEKIPLDPWGNSYWFDASYLCTEETVGCEAVGNTSGHRVVHSGGPNGSGKNIYDADNVVLILCTRP